MNQSTCVLLTQSLPRKKKKQQHKFNAEFKTGIQQNVIPGTYFKCTHVYVSIINFVQCFISHCTIYRDYIWYQMLRDGANASLLVAPVPAHHHNGLGKEEVGWEQERCLFSQVASFSWKGRRGRRGWGRRQVSASGIWVSLPTVPRPVCGRKET